MITVIFTASQYEQTHNKSPRGCGSWAFEIEGRGQDFVAPGSLLLSGAKRLAKAEAMKIHAGTSKPGEEVEVYIDVLA